LAWLCRGGVVFWGDSVGVERIYSKLKHWSSLYGQFYKPSAALEKAAHGKYSLVCSESPPQEKKVLVSFQIRVQSNMTI